MDERDDVTARLRRLGQEPVEPWLASRHLTAMARVRTRPGSAWTARIKIGAAFAVGLLLGGTGLAAANVLPDPAQGVAHDTLAKVGVHVADGDHGVARNTDGCGGTTYKNHGQFVKSQAQSGQNASTAAKSPCGKPLHTTSTVSGANPQSPAQATDCQGPPPWAHSNLTGQAKADAQAQWQATCGTAGTEANDQEAPEAPEAGHQPAAPSGQSGETHGQSGEDHGSGDTHGPTTTIANLPAPATTEGHGESDGDHGQSGEHPTTTTSSSTTSTTAG